jgi:hypothetical protein
MGVIGSYLALDRVAMLLAQPSGDRNQKQSKRVDGPAHPQRHSNGHIRWG